MTDKTTAGIEAEPDEVEALLHNLCGFHLAERDPVARYTVLTREQVLYDALVQAIKRERGRALAELVNRGHRLTEVAAMAGLRSRQQVQRLIQIGNAQPTPGVEEVQEASRQFEERLAAVEATLDEVVSGISVANEPAPSATEPEDIGALMAQDRHVEREPYAEEEPYVEKQPTDTFPAVPVTSGPTVPVTAGLTVPVNHVEPIVNEADDSGEDDTASMFEPTQVMPALSVAYQPTVPLSTDQWRSVTDPDVT
jgi:HPt (histidine-containing phosphotransfer) domain-containing protein